MTEYGRLIGIDVGTKRVGLARTDLLRMSVNPIGTFSPAKAVSIVKELVDNEPVKGFVVGWPVDPKGQESGATKMVDKFMKKVETQCPGIPVYKIDEQYTSKKAVQTLIKTGVPRMKRREKGRIDQAAAALILQKFLERNSDL